MAVDNLSRSLARARARALSLSSLSCACARALAFPYTLSGRIFRYYFSCVGPSLYVHASPFMMMWNGTDILDSFIQFPFVPHAEHFAMATSPPPASTHLRTCRDPRCTFTHLPPRPPNPDCIVAIAAFRCHPPTRCNTPRCPACHRCTFRSNPMLVTMFAQLMLNVNSRISPVSQWSWAHPGIHLLISPAASHSGWEDHFQSDQFHYLHHVKFECNYGTVTSTSFLGTSRAFLSSVPPHTPCVMLYFAPMIDVC